MRETYCTFKQLSKLYEGDTSNLDKLVIEYQEKEDYTLLAVIFCELYPFTVTQVGKYFNLTDSDKASFAVEELHKSMMHFDSAKGAKIQTLYSRYLNRRLYAETSMLNHQKRKANNTCDAFEAYAEIKQGYKEAGFEDAEFVQAINQSNELSENEIKYCHIIMNETAYVTDSEVAREMNISPSAVYQLKQRLKKKFMRFEVLID